MIKQICIFLLFLLCPYMLVCGQQKKDTLSFRVVSYNVENLFDVSHDTLKNDCEFLPNAVRHWDYFKYKKKLDAIARTLVAIGEWTPPALVALCEVENDSVLRDLTRYSLLREAGYRYLMTDSPDERGIDVALLYRRSCFKPLAWQSISVGRVGKERRPTRDILHVSGLLPNMDTLDVFVCHFPSRSGGAKESEPARLQVAGRLRQAVDSLFKLRSYPQLLLMGDLNDYPHCRSIRDVLQAALPPQCLQTESIVADSLRSCRLYHLLARKTATDKDFGSYKYQGEWGLLDHIIVSGNLLRPDASFTTDEHHAHVALFPFLLHEDRKYGGRQPFRTYHGMRYQGGYSDHLPVWAEFLLLY